MSGIFKPNVLGIALFLLPIIILSAFIGFAVAMLIKVFLT